jgi:hypothetical protein
VYRAETRFTPAAGDPVVAEVNGRPIPASEVARRMVEQGEDARQAVASLIDDQLLVAEAERRGLLRDPEVLATGKEGAVYQYLRRTFEREFTPASVPESELRKVYEQERPKQFQRPEIRRFSHVYVKRPWRKEGGKQVLDEAADRRARALIDRVHARAREVAPTTFAAFEALAEEIKNPELETGAQHAGVAREQVLPGFGNALFSLGKPGEISDVIVSGPWYHVAFLVEVVPEVRISYAQARERVLEQVYPGARSRAFSELVNRLKRQCTIRVRPEHLPVSDVDLPAEAN